MGSPWLTIIGIGEDGLAGLSDASRKVLREAETIFGGERHLALAGITDRGHVWPVPFDAEIVLECRGRPTVVLASGDPFWHGVGGSLVGKLQPGEWVAHSAPSTFSLAAARLGWRLENVICLGLHAAPFERLLPHLARGARIVCLVRDGKAASDLARWLTERGWGSSAMWTLSALGGPGESITQHRADGYAGDSGDSLVTVALEAAGSQGIARSSGLPDALFAHDGQLTKRPVRALALSALSPRPGERLWDIGAGSGSISIEWALSGGTAIAVEARGERAANIRSNAASFGLTHRITVIEGDAPGVLSNLEAPDAVFIGGGLDADMFDAIWSHIAPGTRLVAHAVTLETEALLSDLHQRHGGELMRVEIAQAEPLGRYRSWKAARPIVQWSAVR
ncbi:MULTISPECIES: precorrin-6y C5,15-methyltransferase (decarboxylating) subunit CbiE [unclassified Bradyrhizobium]|uniref:precorrin-6y C5,15-methyltransferase (decarboxylating) subunit CbiE n=1 Tax=unclassified Bradyrhizobium TaxID=2631580 RepID=UPI001BA7A265|nr:MULTISPECIES: precorrin-6y C5,15-methyltransferase (decarboxylating) subunit CbiE [unclassified Bradyrhizobium]MBR1202539.1 precorrin-6y C5,15-methyltransferase (decarboxylating) subunit CbiE [Bradyrhizobium sp. AUGA SZCCT0124]MBR1310892.1 precorrin-6y C5,15-methyltransferase (decarboxylating) subunit CbiE [Bradyrhizobium sp. AUGA SZCCT0051]MBR1339488.1 precorrin-6y C5,15-methyltransferase (decarboxylating) subunit CbiE [Bradyrhizobium sp. AUGA SZCCT0105]MBR1354062.1 precorrin-6y C5,15-methy